MSGARTPALTALALIAFAGNSILCRLALRAAAIDPASFTTLRLVSGAMMLALLDLRRHPPAAPGRSWWPAVLLALYAVPFSFAYVSLSAGTGALLLFGAVQVTMLGSTLVRGERPGPAQWTGLALALGGLVYLLLPGIAAPAPGGAALMLVAGVAWGGYSLLGRGAPDPLGATATNFRRAAPFAVALSLLTLPALRADPTGVALAIASGAVASGLGYVAWYTALGGLTRLRASIVQLAVPVIAALGGTLFLGERLTLRLVFSGVLVLGGIALALGGMPTGARAGSTR